jgi:hypothetical protein
MNGIEYVRRVAGARIPQAKFPIEVAGGDHAAANNDSSIAMSTVGREIAYPPMSSGQTSLQAEMHMIVRIPGQRSTTMRSMPRTMLWRR